MIATRRATDRTTESRSRAGHVRPAPAAGAGLRGLSADRRTARPAGRREDRGQQRHRSAGTTSLAVGGPRFSLPDPAAHDLVAVSRAETRPATSIPCCRTSCCPPRCCRGSGRPSVREEQAPRSNGAELDADVDVPSWLAVLTLDSDDLAANPTMTGLDPVRSSLGDLFPVAANTESHRPPAPTATSTAPPTPTGCSRVRSSATRPGARSAAGPVRRDRPDDRRPGAELPRPAAVAAGRARLCSEPSHRPTRSGRTPS